MEKREKSLLCYDLQLFAEDDNNDNNDNNNDQTGNSGNVETPVDNKASDNSAGNASQEKTFTQHQVNTMMAKEKRQGRDAAFRELGIDPGNEKMMSMFKAFIESQNAGIDPEEKIAQVQSETVKAEQRAIIAETKVEAMQLGVVPQYVDDVVTLVSAKMGLDADLDLKSALTELKSKYPMWFTSDNNSVVKQTTGQVGTGSSVSTSSGTDNTNSGSLGSRLAAQKREANKVSGGFWNTKQ